MPISVKVSGIDLSRVEPHPEEVLPRYYGTVRLKVQGEEPWNNFETMFPFENPTGFITPSGDLSKI